MLAVVLLALLTAAAALSFVEPMRRARARDAVEGVRNFDADSRRYARQFDTAIETVIDPPAGVLWRRDAGRGTQIGSRLALPGGCRVGQVRFADGRRSGDEPVLVRCSPLGIGRSYAVQLIGPGLDRWLFVSGLTGETTQVRDEYELDAYFAAIRSAAAAGGAVKGVASPGAAPPRDDVD